MTDRGKLGEFLKEVINWKWDEFVRAEKDPKYSPLQGTVLALVRSCAEGKLGAIKLSIRRVDGNLETPVRVEYPKIYFFYPDATEVAALPEGETAETAEIAAPLEDAPDTEETLLTYGLRETLERMADTPDRRVVRLVLDIKDQVEEAVRSKLPTDDFKNVPRVKSVIAAHLLKLALEDSNFEAITEIFDQIDGKLVETFKMLGDDMFMRQYGTVAPAGSVMQKDGKYKGMYLLEQKGLSDQWAEKLASSKGR